jgi:ribosome-binding protein aMBF1 (putative translation factor)
MVVIERLTAFQLKLRSQPQVQVAWDAEAEAKLEAAGECLSKTPKAGDARITAPVLATADLAKIAKQIQAIQATQGNTSKRSSKGANTPKPALVPVNPPKQTAPPAKEITASTPAQIGAAILAARTTAGLSQNDLAARLKTAQTNIARLERGGSVPSTNTLLRIAKATGHKLVITLSRNL